jgi:hypothetical protein
MQAEQLRNGIAAAWCDRFPVIFIERDCLGANT